NGVSLLIIDRNAEGVSARKLKKLGWHASDTAELNFDNVRVPKENLLGQEGQGFYYLMGGLQLERLAGAIGAVAGAEAALEYAKKYMAEREAFGRSINKFQVLRHRVAQMTAEIESTKYFIYHCARLHNDGKYAVKECSMAKLLATELSDRVTYQSLQFFGGYGFMEEFKIARMFRDSRVGTIGAGTTEIMREIIAKMIIDDTQYEAAGKESAARQSAPKSKPATSVKTASSPQPESKPESNSVTLENILTLATQKADSAPAIGHTIRFDLEGDAVYLDGTGPQNVVSTDNRDAECIVTIKKEHFYGLLTGEIQPMQAFMAGMFKVDGDMSIAMKLPTLFK
ncbi:MAG: acyl-CoA dehydrogenase family protein, partial [Bacteroidota bacterium]